MKVVSQENPSALARWRMWIAIAVILLIALAVGSWIWHVRNTAANSKGAGAFQVVSEPVTQADVPVMLTASGTVSAIQTVDVRPQTSSVVKVVHIREGQFVRKGDRLFTLDSRAEDANLNKAEAQVIKDRADLSNAERNLERVRGLLKQEYVSQSDFDTAQNLVDGLRGQLAIDHASLDASRVARSYDQINAPIPGRTGAIAVYPGSLVQPGTSIASGAVLVSITQLDPINVSFALPERELAGLQQAFAKGKVPVTAKPDLTGQAGMNGHQADMKGHLVFIDNSVDAASGTIRLKAEFPNADHRLWPGMFVMVILSPRTLAGALTVPAQAVQTGPENKFLYKLGGDNKVAAVPINVVLIQNGIAAVEGIAPGTRVVVEGAQNLRPGSIVAEAEDSHGNHTRKGGAKPDSTGKQ
jgi:RND family efflux transporter MFP subunit